MIQTTVTDLPGLLALPLTEAEDQEAMRLHIVDGYTMAEAVREVLLRRLLSPPWQPISTAPEDGTVVWVYTAAYDDLPAFQGPCAYHPDAGWCTDELRWVTHWVPLQTVYLAPPHA